MIDKLLNGLRELSDHCYDCLRHAIDDAEEGVVDYSVVHNRLHAIIAEADDLAQSLGLWRCSCCGEALTQENLSEWRSTGENSGWQHKCPGLHPQAGYWPARWFGGYAEQSAAPSPIGGSAAAHRDLAKRAREMADHFRYSHGLQYRYQACDLLVECAAALDATPARGEQSTAGEAQPENRSTKSIPMHDIIDFSRTWEDRSETSGTLARRLLRSCAYDLRQFCRLHENPELPKAQAAGVEAEDLGVWTEEDIQAINAAAHKIEEFFSDGLREELSTLRAQVATLEAQLAECAAGPRTARPSEQGLYLVGASVGPIRVLYWHDRWYGPCGIGELGPDVDCVWCALIRLPAAEGKSAEKEQP